MYNGQIYKPVSGFQITPFLVHKEWTISNSTYSTYNVQIENSTETYNLLNSIYYASSSVPYRYFEEYNKLTTASIDSSQYWFIGIPRDLYSRGIKKNTVLLTYSTYVIRDDGNGNLIDTANGNEHVGNVFYTNGNIVLTHTGSYTDNFSDSASFSLSFRNNHMIYEHSAQCTILAGELNATLNPSLYSGSLPILYTTGAASGSYIHNTAGFGPYITTIGLYNDKNELLAVGKLAHPIKNVENIDITFNVRYDL